MSRVASTYTHRTCAVMWIKWQLAEAFHIVTLHCRTKNQCCATCIGTVAPMMPCVIQYDDEVSVAWRAKQVLKHGLVTDFKMNYVEKFCWTRLGAAIWNLKNKTSCENRGGGTTCCIEFRKPYGLTTLWMTFDRSSGRDWGSRAMSSWTAQKTVILIHFRM